MIYDIRLDFRSNPTFTFLEIVQLYNKGRSICEDRLMGEHKVHQGANDWVTCSCGKLFSDSRGGRVSKWAKIRKHHKEVNQ